MKNNSIGGEFEIHPDLLKINNSHVNYFDSKFFFSSGRASLYNILKNEPMEKVFIPDYVCPCVDVTALEAEKKIIKYHINHNLLPEIPETKEAVIFLLVNHFSLCSVDNLIEEIRTKIPNGVIILDDVQALWDLKNKHNADYVFSSYRKWLPVPDGSPVQTLRDIKDYSDRKNEFSINKVIGSLLKFYRNYEEVNDEDYLHFFEDGESKLDVNWNCKPSSFSMNILNNIDYDFIEKRRKENFSYLYEKLPYEILNGDIAVDYKKIVDNSSIPMFFPVFLTKRNELRRELMKNNIFCPVHWPLENNKISEKELSLVIDQRYSQEDMERVVKVIKDWCKCI